MQEVTVVVNVNGKEFTFSSREYTFLTATIGQVYFTADREAIKEIEQALKDEAKK